MDRFAHSERGTAGGADDSRACGFDNTGVRMSSGRGAVPLLLVGVVTVAVLSSATSTDEQRHWRSCPDDSELSGCLCRGPLVNITGVDCGDVSPGTSFPLLPYRHPVDYFRLSGGGLQGLEAQLFSASQVPLKHVDLSNNLLRRLADRAFDGLGRTLENLQLGGNRLGDQLSPVFGSSELRRLSNLRRLDLSDNLLRGLDSAVFRGLLFLQELRLENNHLTYLPRGTFQGLLNLTSLHLQNNLLYDLGDFPSLPSLTLIDLSGNQLVYLQGKPFVELRGLRELRFARNRLQELDSEIFEGLYHLEILDLSDNRFKTFPLRSLQKLPKLKNLVLHSNSITNLHSIRLTNLHTLEVLDLRRNSIVAFSPDIFNGMINLKQLRLDVNGFKKISSSMFSGLTNLEVLFLNDNGISSFPSEIVHNIKMIKKLQLSHNIISSISSEIFPASQHLEELSLAYNIIQEIPEYSFRNLQNLILLDLHSNKISKLYSRSFVGIENNLMVLDLGGNDFELVPRLNFPQLRILNLAKNKINNYPSSAIENLSELTHFNISFNRLRILTEALFYRMKNLEVLDVQCNFLIDIEAQTFNNFSNLKEINLRKNYLTEIKEQTFSQLAKLLKLDLAENKISTIKNGAFDNIPQLETLSLSSNSLTSFKGDIFTNSTNLRYIDLSHNHITYLYPNSFSVHSKLMNINLEHNRLSFFPSEILNTIKSLHWVSLGHNKLQNIDDKDFANMKNLRYLNLQNNEIVKISGTAFQNSTQLRTLLLNNNKLNFLEDSIFRGLRRLLLDISHNQLSDFHPELFSKMNVFQLEEINASHNRFREFPTFALKKQYSHIEKANFSFNKISNLPSNADILVNIKVLDLSYNPLTEDAHNILFGEPKSTRELYLRKTNIQSLPLIESPFLRVLNLSGNLISHIHPNAFDKTSMLDTLDLSNNKLNNVKQQLESTWPKLGSLKYLSLSDNPIKYISKESFRSLNKLHHLYLHNLKDLIQFECEFLRKFDYLRSLKLYGYPNLVFLELRQCLDNLNSLEDLNVEIRDPQIQDQLSSTYSSRLRYLEISGDALKSISQNVFSGMNAPRISIVIRGTSITSLPLSILHQFPLSTRITLDLAGNKITTITPSMLPNKLSNIDIVGLHENPITCDCHLQTMWKWLQEIEDDDDQFVNLTCILPDFHYGKSVRSLNLNELTCSETTSTTTTITIPSTVPIPPTLIRPLKTRQEPDIIFEPPPQSSVTTRQSNQQGVNRNLLTKVDTIIIGIVAGVVAFVCILIVIICIVRLRRTRPQYTAGPLVGPLTLRARGTCTCFKPPLPPPCTCYPPLPFLPALPSTMRPNLLALPPAPSQTAPSSRRPSYYVTYPESEVDHR